MADIALVSLALDSSAVVAGEKQATRALQTVDAAMQRTEKQAAQLNTGLNANLKKSGDSFKGLAEGATRAGSALSGLGGPIGRFGGEISSLGGQVEGLTANFGLIGGAALGAVAGVAALGAALTKLTLEGVAVSDEMLDVAESTGLTIDQVQRLSAAARLSGETAGFMESAFRTFQNTIQTAITDPSSDAAKALAKLGIDAQTAGKDTGTAFLNAITHLKEYRTTTEGAVATNEAFGKQIGVLVRSAGNLTEVLQGSREELEAGLVVATAEAVEAAGKLDEKINQLSNSWSVFKQNLAGTSVGAAIGNTIDGMSGSLGVLHQTLAGIDGLISKSRWLQGLLFFGVQMSNPVGLLRELDRSTPNTGAPSRSTLLGAGLVTGGGGGGAGRGAGGAVAKKVADELKLPIGQTINALALLRPAIEYMERQTQYAADAMKALAESDARDLAVDLKNLGTRVERIIEGIPLAQGPGLIQTGGPGQPIPGGEVFGGLPPPGTVRTEAQARLDEQFSYIFDDMLVSILTARKTIGEAFGDLALGIIDVFAVEFTKSLREAFITPVVRGLTDLLQDALGDLFSGLSAKGLKGVFGGIAKGIGTIFGGFFASGGTLGPGKFGIAGERGPELIFAGNQPMHIAPVTAGSAGNVFNISVGVNAPSGSVDKRTQDQLAATVMNAVKRAQRNEGAR